MRRDEEPKAGLLLGTNTLRLNQATMRAAIAAWLSQELASPIVVDEVSEAKNGATSVFEVRIQRRDPPAP
jgi:hypothetical protein